MTTAVPELSSNSTVAPLSPEDVRLPKNIELYVERYCRCNDEDFDDSNCDYVKPKFKKEFRSPYPKGTPVICHLYKQYQKADSLGFRTAVLHCDYCDGALIDHDNMQDIREEAIARYYEKHNMLNPRQIRSIREELGLTIAVFASTLGISERQLQAREAGKALYDKAFSEKVADVVRNWGNWGRKSSELEEYEDEAEESGETGEACN